MTPDQILALAPDPQTARRAHFLAEKSAWFGISLFENGLEARTNSTDRPLAVRFDFFEKTGSCGCFSGQKFCTHIVGLALFFVKNGAFFNTNDAKLAGSPDSEAAEPAAKNSKSDFADGKLDELAAGFFDLENWLLDVARQGLATLQGQPKPFENMAARAVDGKLGSIGRQLRQLASIPVAQPDWAEKTLDRLADFYLAGRAFQTRATLSEALRFDLMVFAGVNFRKDFIQQIGEPVRDVWSVVGQSFEEYDDRLMARKTWLFGQKTSRFALILDFAFGEQPYADDWIFASILEGELSFYPSASPLRAVVKRLEITDRQLLNLPAAVDFSEMASQFSEALSRQPWLSEWPVSLAGCRVFFEKNEFWLVNSAGFSLKMECPEAVGWRLLAIGGNEAGGVFGTWSGRVFQPLSVSNGDCLFNLTYLV